MHTGLAQDAASPNQWSEYIQFLLIKGLLCAESAAD